MNSYLNVLKKYAQFSGRASRQEFWMFVLFHVIVAAVLSIVGGVIHLPWLAIAYIAVTLIPTLALQVRRLHDVDRSGGWWFISFVPGGSIVLLIWACQAGSTADNRFGTSPAVVA